MNYRQSRRHCREVMRWMIPWSKGGQTAMVRCMLCRMWMHKIKSMSSPAGFRKTPWSCYRVRIPLTAAAFHMLYPVMGISFSTRTIKMLRSVIRIISPACMRRQRWWRDIMWKPCVRICKTVKAAICDFIWTMGRSGSLPIARWRKRTGICYPSYHRPPIPEGWQIISFRIHGWC